jgi:glycine cleavage system H protein
MPRGHLSDKLGGTFQMGEVRGCNIPDNLLYSVENNVWVRRDGEEVTVGMTSYACALTGEIVSYVPKRAGKEVKKDMSCATVETATWVGPAKAPIAGEVVAINEAVAENPELINRDPYGAGWLVRIKASDWDTDSTDLQTGGEALAAFEAKMEAEDFSGC